MTILLYTVITLLVIVSLFLILLVLIQKGRGGGLASAFGGVGGHTAFGSKTGDVLTWATAIVFGVFLLLSVGAGLIFERENANVLAGKGKITAPATPALPASSGTSTDTKPANVPAQVPPPAGDPGVPIPATNPSGQ